MELSGIANPRCVSQATQAFYRQCTARAITAIRADLINLIYTHSLSLSLSSTEAHSAAATLMSSDVERVTYGLRNMNECWACVIDAAIALWLLELQMKLAIASTGGLSAGVIDFTVPLPLSLMPCCFSFYHSHLPSRDPSSEAAEHVAEKQ